jgi:NAD(P)-dependent dehydrogenase (short-subunit alcohol dehydrogenase family)
VVAAASRAAHTASKHAVVGLTKQVAMELGDKGIRVDAVGAGVIRTAVTERYFNDSESAQRIKACMHWPAAASRIARLIFQRRNP